MRWALIALIAGIALFSLGYQEMKLAANAAEAPEEISLKKLIERGVEGNPHIILTDFFLGDNIVYSSRKGRWTKVWAPIVALEDIKIEPGKGVQLDNIQALLCSTNVTNAQELKTRLQQPKLKAMVINKIASVGSKERDLLRPSYPSLDFERCLIIEEGREPASVTKLVSFMGGGGASFLVGGFMLVSAWRKRRNG